jgi:hypothetical protein
MSLVLLAAAAALPVPNCPIDRMVYRMHGAPEFTAGFARKKIPHQMYSDLVWWLKTPKRTYWFEFGSPNGYGGTYISSGEDPEITWREFQAEQAEMNRPDYVEPPEQSRAEADYEPLSVPWDAFDANLKAFGDPPQSSDRAPARIFSRALGRELWYSPTSLAGGDRSAESEGMPIGMFEPARCAKAGNGPAR